MLLSGSLHCNPDHVKEIGYCLVFQDSGLYIHGCIMESGNAGSLLTARLAITSFTALTFIVQNFTFVMMKFVCLVS